MDIDRIRRFTGQELFWTIAYRNPRANSFHRVTDWSGTWEQAYDLGAHIRRTNPHLEVWYTTNRASEIAGHTNADDTGNILAHSGRRVPVRDNGSIELLLDVRTPMEDAITQAMDNAPTVVTPDAGIIGAYPTTVRSSDFLRAGDIVQVHGMRVLLLALHCPPMTGTTGRMVYSWNGRVLNRDDVPHAVVPISFTNTGKGWHQWTVQGNDLAEWDVEVTPGLTEDELIEWLTMRGVQQNQVQGNVNDLLGKTRAELDAMYEEMHSF